MTTDSQPSSHPTRNPAPRRARSLSQPSEKEAPDTEHKQTTDRTDSEPPGNVSPISNPPPERLPDPHQIWQKTLHELALQMPQSTYETWVRDTSIIAFEDGEFIIGTPHAYARDWLDDRLRSKIKQILNQLTGRSVQVQFAVRTLLPNQAVPPVPLYSDPPPAATPAMPAPADAASFAPPRAHSEGVAHSTKPQRSPTRPDRATPTTATPNIAAPTTAAPNIAAPTSATPNIAAPTAAAPTSAAPTAAAPADRSDRPLHRGHPAPIQPSHSALNMNPRYTFETFVVGNHNRLAHAAAQSIVDQPGHRFNPLFVYGGVGLGKTHLLHAIGHAIITHGIQVLYCSSEQFTNDLISAIRQQSTEEFRNKYRQVGLLLIDDIQFIGGKESTQEEFFHTFNHLHADGRQIVISSDRPPKEIATLEARLRSRFEGGLQADVTQPDLETRVAILQSKAQSTHHTVSMDVLMLIAERVESNIRELEGALNRLIIQAPLHHSQLNRSVAEEILDTLVPQRHPREAGSVVQIVARHYNLTEQDLRGRKRTKEIANARQMTMYLLREENRLSLIHIGEHLGGRDHSTVRHGVEKVAQDIDRDESVRRELVALREKIYEPPGS